MLLQGGLQAGGRGKMRGEGDCRGNEKILVLRAGGREKRAEEAGAGGEERTQRGWESSEKTQSAGCGAPWRSQCPHILPSPIMRWSLGTQDTIIKPQPARWAARPSWALLSAAGWGIPLGVSDAGCRAARTPGKGLQSQPALQHSPGLPAPSSHLHFLPSPDKVTVYPLGFQAVCTAPRSPLRLDTGRKRNATRQVCANTGAAWSPSVFSLVSKISI